MNGMKCIVSWEILNRFNRKINITQPLRKSVGVERCAEIRRSKLYANNKKLGFSS